MSNEQMSKFPALAKIYQKILRHWHFKNLVFCLQLSVIGHFFKVLFHRICCNENQISWHIPFKSCDDRFLDNVLIYIGGFIMRSLVAKEKCTFCYTYLTECKERVSCSLINVKQLGGLVYPTFDVVSVIQIANRTFENALKTLKVQQVLSMAV